MKFYCLHEGFYEGVQLRLEQLKSACDKLQIEFIPMNSLTTDYSSLPTLNKTDLLYNCARGSETLETLLLNKEVTTFYIKNPDFVVSNPDTTKYSILHEKAKIKTPITMFNITTDRNLLKKYVDYLGGFPIIIKATGSTRGIGTIKIETWQNLISTVDYLINTDVKFILREFIQAKNGCRLVVLGNKVIAESEFIMQENDFRNAPLNQELKYKKFILPKEIKDEVIKSVYILGLEFGGVDILIANENYYILEVNFPCAFSYTAKISEVDIPKRMIEYLVKKSHLIT